MHTENVANCKHCPDKGTCNLSFKDHILYFPDDKMPYHQRIRAGLK